MKLVIDENPVRMNAFVQDIVGKVMHAVLSALDDIPDNPRNVHFSLESGALSLLRIDGSEVRMNAFVQRLIGNMVLGMVRSLDEVPDTPQEIHIDLSD